MKPTIYHVELWHREKDALFDRLWVVISSPQTLARFESWYGVNSTNTAWLQTLPVPLNPITVSGGIPAHPTPNDPRRWLAPAALGTYLYHGAPFGMLSHAAGPYRHQAAYDAQGHIIAKGVRAGRPQRYDSVATPGLHQQEDTEPFIRALQLDGNPCLADGGSEPDLSRPMLRHGGYISQYLTCRPPTLNPGLSFEIEVTSDKAGVSPNPPPFEGGQVHAFNPKKRGDDPNPDKHFVVFYKDVVDSGFTVENFSIKLKANITHGVSSSVLTSLNPRWKKRSGPASGALSADTGVEVNYDNPKMGGVYKFAFDLDGYPRTEFCVVLPLSGALIDDTVKNDIIRAGIFVQKVIEQYPLEQRNDPQNGWNWFYDNRMGDYLGRPDNPENPTVWRYNQVNDSTGFGAVVTWDGVPIRLAKVSNFMVGYACERIGVVEHFQQVAGFLLGSLNDESAKMSFQAGRDIANGSAVYADAVDALVTGAWDKAGEKNQRLWPNPRRPFNFELPKDFGDPNHEFTSPGFLYLTTP